MKNEQIEQIKKDIEAYKAAIEDAEGALQAAEQELDDLLEEAYKDEIPEDFPFQEDAIHVVGNEDGSREILIEISINHATVVSQKVIISCDDLPPF